MSARITGGEHRGRPMRVPPGTSTRPTASRVREAVYSMLGPVTGLRVLDLFAGSGVLALEAISRGAEKAVLVDSDRRAAADARENVATLGLEDRVRVIEQRASTALGELRAAGEAFDLILLDPPYRDAQRLVTPLLEDLVRVAAPGARIVLEGPRRQPPAMPLEALRERSYGETHVQILRAAANERPTGRVGSDDR